MGSRPGSPFGLGGKTPEPSGCLIFGGFTDSPHPHKHETRGLDTIKAISFFPSVAYFSSFTKILRQREICKKKLNIIIIFSANLLVMVNTFIIGLLYVFCKPHKLHILYGRSRASKVGRV